MLRLSALHPRPEGSYYCGEETVESHESEVKPHRILEPETQMKPNVKSKQQ